MGSGARHAAAAGCADAVLSSAWPRGAVGPVALPPVDVDYAASAGLLAGLQRMGRAAAILDRDGVILSINGLAEALIHPLFLIREDRFVGRSSLADAQIRGVIDTALRSGEADRRDVAVLTVSGEPTLIVRAVPIGTTDPHLFWRAEALVTFASAGPESLPSPAFLRGMFGLTAAEATVALALAAGASAGAIARDRAISLETVRSHLKTIFAKTGTKRQATLVLLILQLRDVVPLG